jgi:hypothetical protein
VGVKHENAMPARSKIRILKFDFKAGVATESLTLWQFLLCQNDISLDE